MGNEHKFVSSSKFSTLDNFEIVEVIESFSTISWMLAGHNWELKDLSNNDDNVKSDCSDAKDGLEDVDGWRSRFGMCCAARERT